MFITVKCLTKMKLFCEKIWWNGNLLVLLHSLLRNTLSLSNKRKSSLKDFT